MTSFSYTPLTEEQRATADQIHSSSIVIDGHSDVLMAVADGKIRLSERFDVPDEDGWEPPLGMPRDSLGGLYNFSPHTGYFQTIGFYDIPRLKEGGVTAQAMAIYLSDDQLDRATQRALDMISWLYAEADENDDFSVVTTVDEIRNVKATGNTSGFLTFEGLEPLGYNIRLLDVFYRLGLRMASLTHSRRNAFGDGGNQLGDPDTGGLTQLGRETVARMNQLGIVIDLAHMNLRGSWEIVERSDAPVVLSHARTTALTDGAPSRPHDGGLASPRALWEAIAAKGGLVGIIAYSQPTIADFVDGIVETIAAIGDDHVALGTDFYGFQRAPLGFQGMQFLPRVTDELVARGVSAESISKVLGGNLLRIFEQVWR
jgi:membrane dipeptidase